MTATPHAGAADVEITHPSDTETRVRRRFAHTPAALFRAWTEPDLVRSWWPSRGEMSVCEIDLRPGGAWRWGYTNPEHDVELVYSGIYREITEPSRLAFSEAFEMMPGSDYENVITFEEVDGGTLVTEHMTYSSQEWRDGHRAHGFDNGISEAFIRIERLLASRGIV
jgi:uncharacterized protein YndB with AHSA1/START domain